MTSPNLMKTAVEGPLPSPEPSHPGSAASSRFKKIFSGPNGLRAGWRLLIFLVLIAIQFVCVPFISRPLAKIPPPRDLPQGATTPLALGGGDAILVLMICIASWIMAEIERHKFGDYGLPLRRGLTKDFGFGALLGFLAISGTLLTMFLLHGFRIDGLAIHGTTILTSLSAWGLTFLMVGLFEEFGFRGYVQYTLASGIGFWPTAFVISGLFGLVHLLADLNENVMGSVEVVMFGLLLCLFLRRTGALWCSVGFHLAYDWTETFFYGVPDSGVVPYHSLLNSNLTGPHWLTGGKVGPEASLFTPIALWLVALVFCRYYRENRYQIFTPRPSPGS
jgi:uncharacterized protein